VFPAGSGSDPLNSVQTFIHDVLHICCNLAGGLYCFYLDLTGDQFGLEDWFYTSEQYRKHCIRNDLLDPDGFGEDDMVAKLLDEEPRLQLLKQL
jgi:hypothetical protein